MRQSNTLLSITVLNTVYVYKLSVRIKKFTIEDRGYSTQFWQWPSFFSLCSPQYYRLDCDCARDKSDMKPSNVRTHQRKGTQGPPPKCVAMQRRRVPPMRPTNIASNPCGECQRVPLRVPSSLRGSFVFLEYHVSQKMPGDPWIFLDFLLKGNWSSWYRSSRVDFGQRGCPSGM